MYVYMVYIVCIVCGRRGRGRWLYRGRRRRGEGGNLVGKVILIDR